MYLLYESTLGRCGSEDTFATSIFSPLKIIRSPRLRHTHFKHRHTHTEHSHLCENALAMPLRTPLIRNYLYGLVFAFCALRQVVPAAEHISDHKFHSEQRLIPTTCAFSPHKILCSSSCSCLRIAVLSTSPATL